MCVVSMIGDHYRQTIPRQWPDWQQATRKGPSWEEFNDLKKAVEEMKALLNKAVEYDKVNKEPDCQTDDKLALLRKIAEAVGVDLGV